MVTSDNEIQKTTTHNFVAAAGEFAALVDQCKALCITQFGVDIEEVHLGHVKRLNSAIKDLERIIEMVGFEAAPCDEDDED